MPDETKPKNAEPESMIDSLGLGDLTQKGKKATGDKKTWGRVYVPLFRKGAYYTDGDGNKQKYPDEGNFEAVCRKVGLNPDDSEAPSILSKVFLKLVDDKIGQ